MYEHDGLLKNHFRFYVNNNGESWNMPVEFHNEYELFFVLTGKGIYFISSRYYSFEAGDVLFIRKNELHKCQTYQGESFRSFVILFDDALMNGGMEGANWMDCFCGNLLESGSSFCHHRKTLPALRKRIFTYLDRIREENNTNDIYSRDLITNQMRSIFIELLRLFSTSTNNNSDILELRHGMQLKRGVADAIHYINAHYSENLTLDAIAAQVFLNPSYLSREFGRQTGYSLIQYILSRRISMAKTLLRDSDRQISDIAAEVGFNNPTHFHWAFKKHIGTSPSKYRKTFRGLSYEEPLDELKFQSPLQEQD